MIILNDTPVEEYTVDGFHFYVKREDLCCRPPGPPFSKMRGLVEMLRKLKSKGFTHIGYVETSVSMAGWGVAWACKQLGLTAVIYNPVYKEPLPLLCFHRDRWKEAGATIVGIKAGMAKVNYNICRNTHRDKYADRGIVLPLGLPFEDSVHMTDVIANYLFAVENYGTVVVNIGSGTICAGLMRACDRWRIPLVGVMGRTGSVERKEHVLQKKSRSMIRGMTGMDMTVVDPGWEYTERCDYPCPFPCHPYYDRKAFEWMMKNHNQLKGPVLFWNIGSMPEEIE